jgi:hypothetical protein
MMRGAPASSQIIWLEDKVKEQENEIERLRDALRWVLPYVKNDKRVEAIVSAALKEIR